MIFMSDLADMYVARRQGFLDGLDKTGSLRDLIGKAKKQLDAAVPRKAFQVKQGMSTADVIRRVEAAAPSADPMRLQRFAQGMRVKGAVATNPAIAAKSNFASLAASGGLPNTRGADQYIKYVEQNGGDWARQQLSNSSELKDIIGQSHAVRAGQMPPEMASQLVGWDPRRAMMGLATEHGQVTPRSEVASLFKDVRDDELTGLLGNVIPKAPPRPPAPPRAVQVLRQEQAMKRAATPAPAAPPVPGKVALAFDQSAFLEGARVAALPAMGGILGAGVASAYGVDPLSGELVGAALGAVPEIVHALRHRGAVDPKAAVQLAQQAAGHGKTASAAGLGAIGGGLAGALTGPALVEKAYESPVVRGLLPFIPSLELAADNPINRQLFGAGVGGLVGAGVGHQLGSAAERAAGWSAPSAKVVGLSAAGAGIPLAAAGVAALNNTKTASTKVAFTESQFSGGLGPGPFHNYASFQNGSAVAPVTTVVEGPTKLFPRSAPHTKTAGVPTTPRGLLAKAKAVGKVPNSLAKGPSIAQISKPEGFGEAIAGATKNGV